MIVTLSCQVSTGRRRRSTTRTSPGYWMTEGNEQLQQGWTQFLKRALRSRRNSQKVTSWGRCSQDGRRLRNMLERGRWRCVIHWVSSHMGSRKLASLVLVVEDDDSRNATSSVGWWFSDETVRMGKPELLTGLRSEWTSSRLESCQCQLNANGWAGNPQSHQLCIRCLLAADQTTCGPHIHGVLPKQSTCFLPRRRTYAGPALNEAAPRISSKKTAIRLSQHKFQY